MSDEITTGKLAIRETSILLKAVKMAKYKMEIDSVIIAHVQIWKSSLLKLDPTVCISYCPPDESDDKGLFAVAGGRINGVKVPLSPASLYIKGIET